MKLLHLGDALDHWKGSTIDVVRDELRELPVVPMFTDAGSWTTDHVKLYAKLVRVDPNLVLLAQTCFRHVDRTSYFHDDALKGSFDLFLDPDTGFEPSTRCTYRHLRLTDLEILLPASSSRLALVYQHRRREKVVDSAIEPLRQRKWPCCAFWAGGVSMVFVSRDDGRVAKIRSTLGKFLGPCDGGRAGASKRLL